MSKRRRAGQGDALDHIDAGARGVADVDTQADARVHVAHHFQNRLRRREVLLLGTVVVDGDPHVVFLDQLLHRADVGARGDADHHGETEVPGDLEPLAEIVGVVLRQADVAGAGDLEAGGVEFGANLLEFLGSAVVGEVNAVLDAGPGRLDQP